MPLVHVLFLAGQFPCRASTDTVHGMLCCSLFDVHKAIPCFSKLATCGCVVQLGPLMRESYFRLYRSLLLLLLASILLLSGTYGLNSKLNSTISQDLLLLLRDLVSARPVMIATSLIMK